MNNQSTNQTHLTFSDTLGASVSNNMNQALLELEALKTAEGVKDRINLVIEFETQEEWSNNLEQTRNLQKLKFKLYKKLLEDIERQYTREDGKILFQVPSTHAHDFLAFLIERLADKSSKLSQLDIEYVIIDIPSTIDTDNNPNGIMAAYQELIDKSSGVERFIQIVDYTEPLSSFIKTKEGKANFGAILSYYEEKTREFTREKPKLRLYFPTQKQAEDENLSLEEFYALYERACSIDWGRIKDANEQLAELFREYDEVEISGANADIRFDISGMGARNSTIESNYPGTEVFSAPTINGTNGWIKYSNEIFMTAINERVKGLMLRFKDGLLEEVDIDKGAYNEEEYNRLINELKEKLFKTEANRRLGELAFGTNFFIPAGTKHRLLGEKAIGMHIAIGNSYLYPEVNNGNKGADYHMDLIRSINDGSIVKFKKKSGEEMVIMNNGEFTNEATPKLFKYQQEIKKLHNQ
ncbi:MAG: aminopeptidase [Candidatus Gracilibacteria bacterium]|nr:aminopeptidase [Candidatus Gracilibacteria bacterium]